MKNLFIIGCLVFSAHTFAMGGKENKNNILITPNSENYVNLFIARSPNRMNWKSPSTLAKSLLKNAVSGFVGKRRITLGHVNMEVVCGEKTSYLVMHYREKKEGIKLIFKNKTGMGLLFHNMIGRFDTQEDLEIAKTDFYNGKTSVLSMLVSKDKCERLQTYAENFKENGEQFNYGLNNNPFITESKLSDEERNSEFVQNEDGIPFGAGCSAFVISAMQELGVYDLDTYEEWYAKVRVPERLIGKYSDQVYKTFEETEEYKDLNINPNKKVSILKVILKGKRWAKESEPGQDIVYYSPNKMYEWMESVNENSMPGDNVLTGEVLQINRSPKKRRKQAFQMILDLRD